MRFVDTNVFLYAISAGGAQADKAEIARQLLRSTDLAMSTQVLQEFYWQVTRTSRSDRLTAEDARRVVLNFSRRPVQPITLSVVSAAMHTCERFQISYWDAAIIEAARALGCSEVLTEDLDDGQDYDGVVVRNPFGSA